MFGMMEQAPVHPASHTNPAKPGGISTPYRWAFASLIVVAMALSVLIIAHGAQAQNRTADAYMTQAAADIRQIAGAYDVARGYLAGRNTVTETRQAVANMVELRATLDAKTPPLHMLAIHEQIRFAAGRCENFAEPVSQSKADEHNNVFSVLMLVDLREYCAVQLHAAKMRLIEYGMASGVNPFK